MTEGRARGGERTLPTERGVVTARPDLGGGSATPSFRDLGAAASDEGWHPLGPGDRRDRPSPTTIGGRRFAWGARTYVMGIVNVTPDSFSGDGLLADRTPICVSTTWLSADRFPQAGEVFAATRSMTKLLAHYGVRDYRRGTTRITAGIIDATDAARLDLALGRPILVVDATDVDPDGKPLVTKRSRFAAERVEFLVENA